MARLKPPHLRPPSPVAQRHIPPRTRPVAAYIHHGFQRGYFGSVHKWVTLFNQVCDVQRVDGPSERRISRSLERMRPDFIIVNGDCHPEYKQALASGIPYLIFEHDVVTMRGRPDPAEGEKLTKAAAVLFTSEDHRDYCVKKYDLKHHWLVPLKPLLADMEFEQMRKWPGKTVAFAGSVLADSLRDGHWGYRCYGSILSKLVDLGWTPHVYTFERFEKTTGPELEAIGCTMHYEVPQSDVSRHMSRCTIGLQGYAPYGSKDSKAYVQTCRPNKLWDYLAAGIPTLGVNPGAGGALYNGKWGVVAKSPSERDIGVAANAAARMRITEEMRKAQAIDHHLPDFEAMVEHMMGETCRNRP